ncbi:MAG: hypothetical protein CO109_11185 [Deltaproteobacteria bacterium CG_4_9_14_3_um_filter_65_9]|nr:MAG: hypothetical protein CO109_11185 [Deltaproteobacteria bacterium CG_4_9_14_3_um_filter_65_9]
MLVSKAVAFLAFGLFHGWWRYVSLRDVLPIVGGCALGSLLFSGIDHLFLAPGIAVPHSIYAIDWVLTLMFVLGARYFIRFGREILGRKRRGSWRSVRRRPGRRGQRHPHLPPAVGYRPMYEFHGGPGAAVGAAAPNPRTGTFLRTPAEILLLMLDQMLIMMHNNKNI